MSKMYFQFPGTLGSSEWIVMPLELKNVGATYQLLMISMFHDFIETFIQVYIDDIVIKSSLESGHLDYIRQSFERIRNYILKMNPLKCELCDNASDFLGFMVHKKGITINQNKMKAILNTEPPTTKKKLKFLPGNINFFRRNISNLGSKTKILSPFLRLKKDEGFRWEPGHQREFTDIKEYLSKPLVLLSLYKTRV